MQAEEYRKKHEDITAKNRREYMKWLINKCRKKLDKAGINEYNVGDISKYAYDKYLIERFDETDAEYMVFQKLGE